VISLPAGIQTVIFDLGGVIIDLSIDKTINAFSGLTGFSPSNIQQAYASTPFFKAYERGEVDDSQFRDSIRKHFSTQASDAEIDHCWNAMLVDLPVSTLTMLENLKKHFRVFVLSNTNTIHINYVNEIMLQGKVLDSWVHKAYYSHQLGMRKPELEIYQYVLDQNQLIPEQTIFLDDNLDNLKAANSLYIQTRQITHLQQVRDLFNSYD
jgi:putative hydrolase of the HAD superfamily